MRSVVAMASEARDGTPEDAESKTNPKMPPKEEQIDTTCKAIAREAIDRNYYTIT